MSEAVAYMRRYQAWRRGEDERTQKEAGINPEELGKAIDDVCAEVETWREVSRNQDIALDTANARIAELQKLADDRLEQLNADRDQALKWKRGHDRYEKLRKLNPHEYRELWLKHINGYVSFDDLVDAL